MRRLALFALMACSLTGAFAEDDPDFPPFVAKNKTIGPAERYWLLNRTCYYGDDVGAKMLLAAGADPNGVKDYRELVKIYPVEPSWPINAACWGGHIDIVQLLLDAGAKIDQRESEGYTPLIIAAMNNRPDIVELLLKAGADPSDGSFVGSALDNAKSRGHAKVVELLENHLKKNQTKSGD